MKRLEDDFVSQGSRDNPKEMDLRRSLRVSLTLVVVLIAATAGALYTMTPDFERKDRLVSEHYR